MDALPTGEKQPVIRGGARGAAPVARSTTAQASCAPGCCAKLHRNMVPPPFRFRSRSRSLVRRSTARARAIQALLLAVVAFQWSGCGSPSAGGTGGGTDAGTDAGTGGGATFHVDINFTTGLITFPNRYTGWSVGGGSATNFVAYPSGWSVGGGSATNFV